MQREETLEAGREWCYQDSREQMSQGVVERSHAAETMGNGDEKASIGTQKHWGSLLSKERAI